MLHYRKSNYITSGLHLHTLQDQIFCKYTHKLTVYVTQLHSIFLAPIPNSTSSARYFNFQPQLYRLTVRVSYNIKILAAFVHCYIQWQALLSQVNSVKGSQDGKEILKYLYSQCLLFADAESFLSESAMRLIPLGIDIFVSEKEPELNLFTFIKLRTVNLCHILWNVWIL